MSSDSLSGVAPERSGGVGDAAAGGRDIEADLAALAELWLIPVFVGIVSIVFGVLVVAWPDVTIQVAAVLFGIHLIVYGIFWIVQSFTGDAVAGGRRVLLAVTGVLGLVVGVLCLRNLLQAVEVIALLLGLFWLVSGVLQVVAAVGRATPRRGIEIVMGLLAAAAGVVVLLYPDISLLTLAIILGIWLMIFGIVAVIQGFALRRAVRTAGLT